MEFIIGAVGLTAVGMLLYYVVILMRGDRQ